MRSINKLLFVIPFVLHTIFSVNAINSNKELKDTPLKKDNSYQNNKGNNKPTELKNSNINWKGYSFKNLNIPANTTIENKAEKLNSPTSYSIQDDYLSSPSTTSKSVDWHKQKQSNGLELVSPNLRDVVQEVVDYKEDIAHLSLLITSSKKWISWNFKDNVSSNNLRLNIRYKISTPEITNNSHTMYKNTEATMKVFLNNTFGYQRSNSSSITFNTNTLNKEGQLTVNINSTPNNPSYNSVMHTPIANLNSTDFFKYTLTDVNGDTSTVEENIINVFTFTKLKSITINEFGSENLIQLLENYHLNRDEKISF